MEIHLLESKLTTESDFIDKLVIVLNISKKPLGLDKKCSNSRLVKSEKCEFTPANNHFEVDHNAEVGLFLQTLLTKLILSFNNRKPYSFIKKNI